MNVTGLDFVRAISTYISKIVNSSKKGLEETKR